MADEMLEPGLLAMTLAEKEALDALVERNTDAGVSLTREGHGETGPLLAYVGGTAHRISEDGRVQKLGDS